MTTGEELFEMLGIAYFNYALLTYLSIEFDGITFNIESSGV
jgi:hypothetical protein